MWFAGSTLRRDLSLPRLRARFDVMGKYGDTGFENYLLAVWTQDYKAAPREQERLHMPWRRIERGLRQVTADLTEDVRQDLYRWTQVTAQTAELVVVLTQFDPDNTVRLHRTADFLARAAQPDRSQSRARPQQEGVVLPLLVYATRTAAICKSPAPLVLAAIVVLVHLIISTLQRLADKRERRVHASARQYVAAAQQELRDHPAVLAEIQSAEQVPVHDLPNAPREQLPANSNQPKRGNLFSGKAKPWSSAESLRGRTR